MGSSRHQGALWNWWLKPRPVGAVVWPRPFTIRQWPPPFHAAPRPGGVVTDTAYARSAAFCPRCRAVGSGGDTFPWESGARGTGGGGERGRALKGPHPAREQSGRGGASRAERRVSGRGGAGGAGVEGGLRGGGRAAVLALSGGLPWPGGAPEVHPDP